MGLNFELGCSNFYTFVPFFAFFIKLKKIQLVQEPGPVPCNVEFV
jgi:hypothetical protein